MSIVLGISSQQKLDIATVGPLFTRTTANLNTSYRSIAGNGLTLLLGRKEYSSE